MPRVPPLRSGVLTGQIKEGSLLTLLLFHAEANQPDQFGGMLQQIHRGQLRYQSPGIQ
jgi:hypothetical protein